MKGLYIAAWFLLIAAAFVTVLTGTLNPAALVTFSLFTLGLVYALAFWSVLTNTREMKPE